MKALLAILILFSGSIYGAEVVSVPTRVGEIEKAYTVKYLETVVSPHGKGWIFLINLIEPFKAVFPITVPVDATDHDVDVALVSATNCAMFYEAKASKKHR